jgi:hypothetical protein
MKWCAYVQQVTASLTPAQEAALSAALCTQRFPARGSITVAVLRSAQRSVLSSILSSQYLAAHRRQDLLIKVVMNHYSILASSQHTTAASAATR